MTKQKSLSHQEALQDTIKFLAFSKGLVSKRDGEKTPVTPGLDIFVPFTEARRVQLVGDGSVLDGSIKQIVTLSIAGTNNTRVDVLSGKPGLASSANNMWWNIPLVICDTPEAATAALELGAMQHRPMPLVRLSDLIDTNNDPVVSIVLNALLAKSEDTAGPSYYNLAKPIIEDPAQAFFIFAPSSSPGTPDGLWTNPPSKRQQRTAPTQLNSSSEVDIAG